jgi:hypothetical protein
LFLYLACQKRLVFQTARLPQQSIHSKAVAEGQRSYSRGVNKREEKKKKKKKERKTKT